MSLQRVIGWGALAVVLLAVFMAYLKPDLAMTLASQLWACL